MLSVAARTAATAPGGGPSAFSGAEKSRSGRFPSFSRARIADWLPPCWMGSVAWWSSMRFVSVRNEDEMEERPTTRAGHGRGSRSIDGRPESSVRPASRMPAQSGIVRPSAKSDAREARMNRIRQPGRTGRQGPAASRRSRRRHGPGQSSGGVAPRAWTARRRLVIIFASRRLHRDFARRSLYTFPSATLGSARRSVPATPDRPPRRPILEPKGSS